MSNRIATFATNASMLNQAMNLQSSYSTTQLQSSSGLKSENFSGIASDSGQLLNLESQSSALTAQVAAITAAQNQLNSTQDATTSISSLLQNIGSQITTSLDGAVTASAGNVLANQATDWISELQGLLNTQYAGTYLFGGTVQNKPPVDTTLAAYDPTTAPTTANTKYYQGDDTTQSVRASNALTVNYGVTADNPAFEQIFRALSLIVAKPTDTATLNQAYTMIQTAGDSVADITATLSSQGNILTKEAATQTATLDTIGQSISNLRDVDVTVTAVKLTTIQTQLEASYSTLVTLLKLNLSQYLR